MKQQLTKITLSALLAMASTTALNLQAGAQAESLDDLFEILDDEGNFEIPIISDITNANEAVNDAVDGIIDGVCYKDAYLVQPQFDPLVCPDGFVNSGIACLKECSGSWKYNGLFCAKCSSGFKFKHGMCKKKRGWFTEYRIPQLKLRDVEDLECPRGQFRDGLFCYDRPDEGYSQIGGVAW